MTNTNWQNCSGESTMSHLTQMAGRTVQNFVSAAVGMAVAVALIRGLGRRSASTIGSFWVDVTRTLARILLPLAFIFALVLVSQGVVQNVQSYTEARTVDSSVETQLILGGPIASQEAIKEFGHFVLTPTVGHDVSLEERHVAAAVAQLLAYELAARRDLLHQHR